MQETTTNNSFAFGNLPKHVQDEILANWRDHDEFPWHKDWVDTLKEFASGSPLAVRKWEVGYRGGGVTFDIEERGLWNSREGLSDEWADRMTGVRLWKFLRRTYGRLLRKACPLTGYCGDEDILGPIREAIASHPRGLRHTTLRDVLADCFAAWVSAYEADIDYWHSDECVKEDIEANDYRFDEDGELVP